MAQVVAVVDLDANGRADVVVTPAESAGQTSRIEWFRAPADPRNQNWTRSPLSATVSSTHDSLQILDGDLDVAMARMQPASQPVIEVLLNEGSSGSPWAVDVAPGARRPALAAHRGFPAGGPAPASAWGRRGVQLRSARV